MADLETNFADVTIGLALMPLWVFWIITLSISGKNLFQVIQITNQSISYLLSQPSFEC